MPTNARITPAFGVPITDAFLEGPGKEFWESPGRERRSGAIAANRIIRSVKCVKKLQGWSPTSDMMETQTGGDSYWDSGVKRSVRPSGWRAGLTTRQNMYHLYGTQTLSLSHENPDYTEIPEGFSMSVGATNSINIWGVRTTQPVKWYYDGVERRPFMCRQPTGPLFFPPETITDWLYDGTTSLAEVTPGVPPASVTFAQRISYDSNPETVFETEMTDPVDLEAMYDLCAAAVADEPLDQWPISTYPNGHRLDLNFREFFGFPATEPGRNYPGETPVYDYSTIDGAVVTQLDSSSNGLDAGWFFSSGSSTAHFMNVIHSAFCYPATDPFPVRHITVVRMERRSINSIGGYEEVRTVYDKFDLPRGDWYELPVPEFLPDPVLGVFYEVYG